MPQTKKKTAPYEYDTQAMHIVISEGGSSGEVYIHPCDSESDAEATAADIEKHTYNVIDTELIFRTQLERMAPHMYTILDTLKMDGTIFSALSPVLQKKIKKVLREAKKTEHFNDIIAATEKQLPIK